MPPEPTSTSFSRIYHGIFVVWADPSSDKLLDEPSHTAEEPFLQRSDSHAMRSAS